MVAASQTHQEVRVVSVVSCPGCARRWWLLVLELLTPQEFRTVPVYSAPGCAGLVRSWLVRQEVRAVPFLSDPGCAGLCWSSREYLKVRAVPVLAGPGCGCAGVGRQPPVRTLTMCPESRAVPVLLLHAGASASAHAAPTGTVSSSRAFLMGSGLPLEVLVASSAGAALTVSEPCLELVLVCSDGLMKVLPR